MRLAGIGLLAIKGIAIAAAFGLSPVSAQPVEDFYQKRQITLIVSTTVSGGYDMYARTFARSFPRHIPGNPTIVLLDESEHAKNQAILICCLGCKSDRLVLDL